MKKFYNFGARHLISSVFEACVDPEGSGGPDLLPLENHKARVFLSNTGPDPQPNHKATKSAFNFGSLSARQRNVIY